MNSIIDINQDQFLSEVVEKSKTVPVLVDFWAPWCGPCKQLTPILERLVNKKNGKIILAKINVDENQGLAGQLNIQSIPTVYGFVNGRPIDAFQGAQPENKIEMMIEKLIDATPGNEVPKLIEKAEGLLKEKKYEEAKNIFENLLSADASNPKIITGLLRCLIQLHLYDDAKQIFESLEEDLLQNEEVIKIKKLLDNLNAPVGETIDELTKKLNADPKDLDMRFKLAEALLSNNEPESGFTELLNIFKENAKWKDEAAKKKLLEYFDLLGPTDPNVIAARRKLSSLLFR